MQHTLLRIWAALLVAASFVSAQWQLQSPAASPTARTGAVMTFVPMNSGLVLFGGSAPLIDNQTWVYDGTDWTQLAPTNAPTARSGGSLVFDSGRGVAVLYGGLATNISIPPPASDTWEWDGVDWTNVTTAGTAGPRYRQGACFDSLRNRVVMYGGATTQLLTPPSNATWEYDGVVWSQITTTGNPGPRERPAMCYFPSIGRTVLFGGNNGGSLVDQTWVYDGVSGTWTQLTIPGAKPPARNAAVMVHDPVRDLCVLHGGQDTSGPLTDTWVFDGAAWCAQTANTQPVRDHAMAFLPTTNQVVRFGGFVAAPTTTTNQTWELGTGAFGHGCVGTNGTPALSATTAPLSGSSWTVDVTGLNTTFNLGFVVLGFVKAPGVDLGFLGMPGCLAYTSPDVLLGITGTSGTANWTWPNVSGPIGATFFAQVLGVDPTVNAFCATVSNALYATLTN